MGDCYANKDAPMSLFEQPSRPPCPKGEHVHRDGTRWPTGRSCGGDRSTPSGSSLPSPVEDQ